MQIKTKQYEEIETDVVVLGAGASGIRAAVEASKGAKVILVAKGAIGFQGSTFCSFAPCWAYQAALGIKDSNDNPREHSQEIMDRSLGLASHDLVDLLTKEAPSRLEDIIKFGLKPDRRDGALIQETGCFSRRPRLFMFTGKDRIRKVFCSLLNTSSISVLSDTMALDIIVEEGECRGVIVLKDNAITVIWSDAVIIATGGAGQLFAYNFSTSDLTGDGQAMALRAGAILKNIEFYQIGFGITGKGRRVLFEGRLLQYAPKIYNIINKEYLEDYLPKDVSLEDCFRYRSNHMPFSVQDVSYYLDTSTHYEIFAGRGTENNAVYADYRAIPKSYFQTTSIGEKCFLGMMENSIEPDKEIIELTLHQHAMNGGIEIDVKSETCIQGLFAAGEVAAGPHGADRLGGNMMATTQVFGARAGRFAVKRKGIIQNKRREASLLRFLEPIQQICSKQKEGKVEDTSQKLIEAISFSLWQNAMVNREEKELLKSLDSIHHIKEIMDSSNVLNGSLKRWMELRNMLLLGESIIRGSLNRKESRGSFHRRDYPNINHRYSKPLKVVYKEGTIFIDDK